MRGEIIQNYHLTFRYLENIISFTLIIIIVLFLRIPLPCQENNSIELFNSQCAICFIIPPFLFRYHIILLCTTTYYCLYVVCSYVHQICAWKIKYLLHHPLHTLQPYIYSGGIQHSAPYLILSISVKTFWAYGTFLVSMGCQIFAMEGQKPVKNR